MTTDISKLVIFIALILRDKPWDRNVLSRPYYFIAPRTCQTFCVCDGDEKDRARAGEDFAFWKVNEGDGDSWTTILALGPPSCGKGRVALNFGWHSAFSTPITALL